MIDRRQRPTMVHLVVDNGTAVPFSTANTKGRTVDRLTELTGELAKLMKASDVAEKRIFEGLAAHDPTLPDRVPDWPVDLAPEDPTASEIYEPYDDAPLNLEQAVCLPELGGVLRRSSAKSTASAVFAVKTLRKAIADGALGAIRPNTKNLYVSRNLIREWLHSCHVKSSPTAPSSAKESRATTPQAVSRTAAPSSSTTPELPQGRLRQDAVSAMIASMRKL